MTSAELRAICGSLIDKCNMDGHTRLAHFLGRHHSTVERNLHGQSALTQADELAIRKAEESHPVKRGSEARRRRRALKPLRPNVIALRSPDVRKERGEPPGLEVHKVDVTNAGDRT